MSQTGTGGGGGWRAALVVPVTAVPALEQALALDGAVVSSFEGPNGAGWCVEAYYVEQPKQVELQVRVAAAAAAMNMAQPALALAPLPDIDWLAENRKSFAPLKVSRFFLHSAHDRDRAPRGVLPLEVEAGRAFGTGRHETTQGCLLALQVLARARAPLNALDLGCGSGILALAMARLWRRPVLASDIDPWAVRTARSNARINALAPLLTALQADGLNHRALRSRAPYDLIVANILAAPLLAMARPIAGALAPGGHLILSGLLARQQRAIVAKYRDLGMVSRHRVQLGEWPTLLLVRR